MRSIVLILTIISGPFIAYGQDSKKIKGIAVENTGTPIAFCNVSIKGTKIATKANQCGEFELTTSQKEFTIVFNGLSTHDFITFEKRVDVQEILNGNTIIFQLRKHGKTTNKGCKKNIDKKSKKIFVN